MHIAVVAAVRVVDDGQHIAAAAAVVEDLDAEMEVDCFVADHVAGSLLPD